MPKRILEDGKVILTKDEFVQMLLRDQKRRKLKRKREELELYGELDDLDCALSSKNNVKDDFNIDELIKAVGIEAKGIVNNMSDIKEENLTEPNTKVKSRKKNTKKEKAILPNVIPNYEIKGMNTKDGNEQLSFAF